MINSLATIERDKESKSNNINVLKHLCDEEYEHIKDLLKKVGALERVYYSVVPLRENFIELNKLLMQYENNDISEDQVEYYSILRIQNFLSSVRGFIDTFAHTLSRIYGGDSELCVIFQKLKTQQYDTFFSYRFVEAYRNYVQHRGMPINFLTFTYENNKKTFKMIMTKRELLDDKKISSSKKADIDNNCGDTIDILHHLNEMAGLLFNIHDIIVIHAIKDTDFGDFFEYKRSLNKQGQKLIVMEYDEIQKTIKSMLYFKFELVENIIADANTKKF